VLSNPSANLSQLVKTFYASIKLFLSQQQISCLHIPAHRPSHPCLEVGALNVVTSVHWPSEQKHIGSDAEGNSLTFHIKSFTDLTADNCSWYEFKLRQSQINYSVCKTQASCDKLQTSTQYFLITGCTAIYRKCFRQGLPIKTKLRQKYLTSVSSSPSVNTGYTFLSEF
jgi:hypothetical protein